MTAYAKHVKPEAFTQQEKLPGTAQERNAAGGFSYVVDDFTRLRRFLVLGCAGGTYYAGERKLTLENADCARKCFARDAARTVGEIHAVSVLGRAPKNDPAVFALAVCAAQKDNPAGRQLAFAALPDVCRIPTHVFQFVGALRTLKGWGKKARKAVARWYTEKPAADLAHAVTKYPQREGWAHRDLLRLCRPVARSADQDAVFRYAVTGKLSSLMADREVTRKLKGAVLVAEAKASYPARTSYPPLLDHVEQVKLATDPREVARLVRDHGLPREVVPTQFLNSPDVWDALLHAGEHGMPLTALVRNLGKMTAVGLLKPLSEAERFVVGKLTDAEQLRRARVHPVQVLLALGVYRQGHGDKGSLAWGPSQAVLAALDRAFHLAFAGVEPTGKRFLLALDVSGSMASSYVAGSRLTAREVSAAMALVTLKTEPACHVIGFTGRGFQVAGGRPSAYGAWAWHTNNGGGVEPLPLTAADTLTEAVARVSNLPMGPTDCALPWVYAATKGIEVDVCVTYTDNETWHGAVHPSAALDRYRQKTGIPARSVVAGLTATQVSIADPNDPLSLDVAGCDSSLPQVLAEFARG